MNQDTNKDSLAVPKQSIYAYTDGCNSGAIDNNTFVGSGVWLSERPSTRVPSHTMSFKSPNDGTNNIKGEIYAAMAAIKWAWDNNYKILVVVTDLEGIMHWGNGKWKATKPITAEFKQSVESYKHRGMDIRFIWTKGHLGAGRHAYGNNQADKLAAQALGK